jgi:1-acyl-sn-glycerol-3-phosphate acyltransferase
MDKVDLRNQGEFLRIEEEKRFLKLINCEVHTFGDVPKRGLIVCNHLSYLDVLVLLKACPAAFVAKNEVRRWPFFGLLATMAGTVFVDRQRRTAISEPLSSMVETLRAEVPVVIFPEEPVPMGRPCFLFEARFWKRRFWRADRSRQPPSAMKSKTAPSPTKFATGATWSSTGISGISSASGPSGLSFASARLTSRCQDVSNMLTRCISPLFNFATIIIWRCTLTLAKSERASWKQFENLASEKRSGAKK